MFKSPLFKRCVNGKVHPITCHLIIEGEQRNSPTLSLALALEGSVPIIQRRFLISSHTITWVGKQYTVETAFIIVIVLFRKNLFRVLY